MEVFRASDLDPVENSMRVLILPFIAGSVPSLSAQEMVPATFAGHASLPAFSFTAPPEDAPVETWISGRFTAGMIPVNTRNHWSRTG
jgi:hypothetical protein